MRGGVVFKISCQMNDTIKHNSYSHLFELIAAIGGSFFAVRLVQADALPSSAPLVFDGAKYDRTMEQVYE